MSHAINAGHPISRSMYRIPFGGGREELPSKEIVGSKANNLMRMAGCGLPVPPGFVIAASVCRDYRKRGEVALAGLEEMLEAELHELGRQTQHFFGDAKRPLLVSACRLCPSAGGEGMAPAPSSMVVLNR